MPASETDWIEPNFSVAGFGVAVDAGAVVGVAAGLVGSTALVGTDAGAYVELQGTAEGKPFDRASLDELLALANVGLARLFEAQAAALATVRR